jgi:hypothetical protein
MELKKILCYKLLLLTASLFASPLVKPTLDLVLDKPTEAVIEGKKFPIKGTFYKDKDRNGLLLGKQKGISIPAEKLFGKNKGTIFVRFRMNKPQVDFKTPRYFLTIRGKERTWIGFCRYGDNKLYMNFRYVGQQYYMRSSEKLNYNKWYTTACTWDGLKVRFYLNGIYEAEQKQHVPAEFPHYSKLNLGPFKDGYVTARLWNEDDIVINELVTFDKALNAEEIAELSGVEVKSAEKIASSIVIPKLNKEPKLDGTLDDPAWKRASSFVSLIDGNIPTQSLAYPKNNVLFCYDQKNLYIGFRAIFPRLSNIPKGSKRVNKDIEVWPDESFELYIENKGLYRFAGNVAGGYTESLDKRYAFNKKWIFKSTLRHQIDDSQLWEGEIAIPFSTINMKTPKEGQELKFNFCRTWRTLDRVGITSFGDIHYSDVKTFANMVFGGKTCAVQSLDLSNPNLGTFAQKLLISSPVAGNYKYTVTLLNSKGITPPAKLIDEDIKLSADSNKVLSLDKKITQSNYDTLLFQLKDQKNYKVIMEQTLPFKITADYFSSKSAFSSEKLLVYPHVGLLKDKVGPEAKFILTLKDPSGNTIFRKNIISDSIVNVKFIRSNPAGKYQLSLQSIKDKQKVVQTQKTFYYPGIKEWEKQQYSPQKVLFPFTPLKNITLKNGVSVASWGRVYKWENTIFPSAISSNNIAMLNSPILITVNGESVKGSKTVFSHTSQARSELESIAYGADYKILNKAWIEYDGLLWNTVKISANRNLKDIQLNMKLPQSIAKYLHAAAGGFGASGGFTSVVKDRQELKFYPVIWLGDQERGLCWFAESTTGWQTSEKKPIKIIKNADETILQIRFADSLKSGESMQFSFGLIATPVKPLPVNYPLNTFNAYHAVKYNMAPPNAPTSSTILHSGRLGEGFGDLHVEDLDELKSSVKLAHSNYAKCIPYMDPVNLPDEYTTASAYREEWQMLPERHLSYKYKNTKHELLWCCPASKAADFFVWKTKQLIKQSNIDGIYFDFGQVRFCKNEIHGCKGRYPLLAMRNFYRSIANAFVEAGNNNYQIILHASEAIQVPAFTFITTIFNGEHLRQQSSEVFHNGKDILDTFTLADFATEYSSLPWGITSSIYMPTDPLQKQYGGHKDAELYVFRMTKAFLAGSLIHNTIPAINRGHFGLLDKLIRIYDKFEVPKAQFMPYWSNQKAVRVLTGKDIYVSAYKHYSKSEILLIVSHVAKTHDDQLIKLQLNPEEFGIGKISSAKELLTEEQIEYQRLLKEKNRRRIPVKMGDYGIDFKGVKDNQITLFLKNHSVAIIHITGK